MINGVPRTEYQARYGEDVRVSVSKAGYNTVQQTYYMVRDVEDTIVLDRATIGYAWSHAVSGTMEIYTIYTANPQPSAGQRTLGGSEIATTSVDATGNVEAISVSNIGFIRDEEKDLKYGDTIPKEIIPS